MVELFEARGSPACRTPRLSELLRDAGEPRGGQWVAPTFFEGNYPSLGWMLKPKKGIPAICGVPHFDTHPYFLSMVNLGGTLGLTNFPKNKGDLLIAAHESCVCRW